MSEGWQHRTDQTVDREEHISADGEQTRKAVGLFARDSYGTGTFELSAISTASGAVLNTTPANVSANVNIGNVTLNPSPNHIGSVTIFGTVQSTPGMTTLFGGPNQIGSVTISNQLDIRSILSAPTLNVVTQAITVNSGMTTLFPGPNQIGSVTVSNFTAPNTGNVTLNASPNSIGLVTVANTVPVTGSFFQSTQPVSFNQLVSLASGTEIRSLATVLNFPATQPVSFGLVSLASGTNVGLNPSSNYIGLVTANIVGTINTGMTTIFPGPNQIGSVTVSNFPATQPVSFGLVSLASGTEVRSLATILNFPATQAVTQSGTWNVGLTALTSLASGTEVRSLATILNQPALVASSAYIGLASVNIGGTLPALSAGNNQIGSVTIFGNISSTPGMTTIFPGPNFIGLATTYPGRSLTTLFAGYVSASGYSTIFVPPSGKRFFIHNVLLNSMGNSVGSFIGSSTNPMIPWTSLATYGGFPYNQADPGLPAPAVDQALTFNKLSTVTLSYSIGVHFE